MKQTVELKINGHRLVVKSGEDESSVRAIECYLNHKIEEVKENTKAVSTLDLALLAALNITGEALRTKEMLEELERKSERMASLIDSKL